MKCTEKLQMKSLFSLILATRYYIRTNFACKPIKFVIEKYLWPLPTQIHDRALKYGRMAKKSNTQNVYKRIFIYIFFFSICFLFFVSAILKFITNSRFVTVWVNAKHYYCDSRDNRSSSLFIRIYIGAHSSLKR